MVQVEAAQEQKLGKIYWFSEAFCFPSLYIRSPRKCRGKVVCTVKRKCYRYLNSGNPDEQMTWLAISSPTLLSFITESRSGVISYKPQRILRQLGYNQSAIRSTGEIGSSDSINAQSQFIGLRKHILSKNFMSPTGQGHWGLGKVSRGFYILEKIVAQLLHLCWDAKTGIPGDP